jgi:hypothetical protein
MFCIIIGNVTSCLSIFQSNKRCDKIRGAYEFKSSCEVLKSQRLTRVIYMKL